MEQNKEGGENMNVKDLSEQNKSMLWCFGALKELVDLGLTTQGEQGITTKGILMFDQLDAEYSPSDEQIKEFVVLSKSITDKRVSDLMISFRDNREEMRKWVAENRSEIRNNIKKGG